jgi:hypothetical protein
VTTTAVPGVWHLRNSIAFSLCRHVVTRVRVCHPREREGLGVHTGLELGPTYATPTPVPSAPGDMAPIAVWPRPLNKQSAE